MKPLLCLLALALCACAAQLPKTLPIRPNPKLTPGAVGSTDTAKVCKVGYSTTVRHTSEALKARVYASYGLHNAPGNDFEIDHLIPLSLGGADTQQNLWPQSYLTKPNAREKDRLEVYILWRVCVDHSMSLAEGQRVFLGVDWIAAYHKYLGTFAWEPDAAITIKK